MRLRILSAKTDIRMVKDEELKCDWINYPVFIVGYPKSGTTMLVGLLDGHEDLVVFPEETSIMSKVTKTHKSLVSQHDQSEMSRIWTFLMRHTNVSKMAMGTNVDLTGNYDYSNFNFDDFKKEVHIFLRDKAINARSIFESLVTSYAKIRRKTHAKMWVEKSPRHYEHIDELIKIFPKAKIVHIIRDPRDNWISYSKKKGGSLPIEYFCYHWRNAFNIAQKNRTIYGPGQYHVVYYEDFVVEPTQHLLKLAEFLSIPYVSSLEQPTRNGNPWSGNSMWNDRFKTISKDAIGRYRSYGSREEIEFIESALGNELKVMGYDPISKSIRPILKLAVISIKKRLSAIWED